MRQSNFSAGQKYITRNTPQHVLNNQIKHEQVHVLNAHGEHIGNYKLKDAIVLANEQGLDLMQVGVKNDIAICKVLKYDAWVYHQKKKQDKQNIKNKNSEIKTIQVRTVTGEHDFQLKMRQAIKFLEEGHKIKISLKFKTYRETLMSEINSAMIEKIMNTIGEFGELEGGITQGQREINFHVKSSNKKQIKTITSKVMH